MNWELKVVVWSIFPISLVTDSEHAIGCLVASLNRVIVRATNTNHEHTVGYLVLDVFASHGERTIDLALVE